MFPKDRGVDFTGTYAYSEGGTYDFLEDFKTNYKTGIDLDLIGGYDFGMVRGEVELGWKKAKQKSYDNIFLTATSSDGDTFTYGPYDIDADGKTTVLSVMVNALLDFGDENGVSFYAGPGIGWAKAKYHVGFADDLVVVNPLIVDENAFDGSLSDSGFAWQVIAGIRYAISPNIDLGLKYRFFKGPKIGDSRDFDLGFATGTFDADTRFSSHSLLLSFVYNFAEPPPPPPPPPPTPPPPPPPPATQTCPDGSVILATDVCPAPPPPPPPPPPAPERG